MSLDMPSTAAPAPPPASPAAPQPAPAAQQQIKKGIANLGKLSVRTYLRIALAAIVIILGVFVVWKVAAPSGSTTTVITTTISQANFNIGRCTRIASPGIYYVQSDINTSINRGACIDIASSNVNLIGGRHALTGSGPYTAVPPFSYGIRITGQSNVTVSGMRISRFSYGVYVNSTRNSVISGINVTNATMSGIYLINSSNNQVVNDASLFSKSGQGGMNVQGGGGNRFMNDSAGYSFYQGLMINSSNNKFSKMYLYQNPTDLVCGFNSSFVFSNNFTNSVCQTNNGCAFAQCTVNVPPNLASKVLKPGPVSSCGSITSPGTYTLASSINASAYVPVSQAPNESCIRVSSINVNLNCNGKSITGSGYGVYVASSYNLNVTSCNFANDVYGIWLGNSFNAQLNGINASKGTYGIYISNSSGSRLQNIDIENNTYGVYMNQATGIQFQLFKILNNKFGFYENSGGSNVYNNGKVLSNRKADIYCSAATYTGTSDIISQTQCLSSSCKWAAPSICPILKQVNLTNIQLNGCGAITLPGTYALTKDAPAVSGTCFKIMASNVSLSCGGHSITGSSTGSVFSVMNETNVSISSCKAYGFTNGISAANDYNLSASSLYLQNMGYGLVYSNVTASLVQNVTVTQANKAGMQFSGLSHSSVMKNIVADGVLNASGYRFLNSSLNNVIANNATSSPIYGFLFAGSLGNNVVGNGAFSNAEDYYCSGSATSYSSEKTNVDYGFSKQNCPWIILLPSTSQQSQCASLATPSYITLSSDMLYTSGSTCFNTYLTSSSSANGTTIDCMGHEVLATRGGTFLNNTRASNVKVQNCVIRNFTTAVASTGPSFAVVNDVILGAGRAISISNSQYAGVSGTSVMNSGVGVYAINSLYASIRNNVFVNDSVAMKLNGTSSSSIVNNTASKGAYGLTLQNSTTETVGQNRLTNMSSAGIACYGTSAQQGSANIDTGQNVCSSNANCVWVTSPQCK